MSTNTGRRITRDDTLSFYGFTVLSPRIPSETPLLLVQQDFEAVVIGHSVQPTERKEILASIREIRPQCPIIFVYVRPEAADETLADEQIDITESLLPLIAALEKLTTRRASDKKLA